MNELQKKLKEAKLGIEIAEIARGRFAETNFPKSARRYSLIFESFALSVEEIYFWLLNTLKVDLGYTEIIKINDVFTSSEQSAFWGQQRSRLGLTEDRVMKYMQSIGAMLKELHQIVRDLRITSERLQLYEDSARGDISSETSLKNIWITMVEGGTQNPDSVYGLSNQLGFRPLADLFFIMNPKKSEDVDKEIEKQDVNRKLKEVLSRKIKNYLIWKEHTWKEVKYRKSFALKYMEQHYNVMRMYMEWVKPYLKSAKRLQERSGALDKPELISAFENALIEIEVLAKKPNGKANSCILVNVTYEVKPLLQFQQDSYQSKGPIHVGRAELELRSYGLTDKEVDAYVKIKEEETFKLLGELDKSLKETIDALGEDVKKFLEEAKQNRLKGEIEKKEEKGKAKGSGILEPFESLGKGFGDLARAFAPSRKGNGVYLSRADFDEIKEDKEKAAGSASNEMWIMYKNFKKSHGMLAW